MINLESIKQRNFLCGSYLLYQLQIYHNLSEMARRIDPLNVNSLDEYRASFGNSDEEDIEDIEGDSSDIDFSGIEEDGVESNEEENDESGNEEDTDGNEEDQQQWTAELSNIVVDGFSARFRIVVEVGIDPKADDFFTLMFDDGLFDKIVEETNRYVRQKLADNEQRLGRWRDVSKPDVKAYFVMCTVMAMNILPKVADYWSSDIFMGNEEIKKVMPKN